MRYIIFSDVHSNLESLRAFIQVTEDIDHDKKVCLGDLVGYNADPNPVLNWIRKNVDIVLGGNHDYAVVGKTDISYFNPHAYHACLWTRKELTKTNKEFLLKLSFEKEEDGIHWVHSSPFEPEEWHYVNSIRDGKINFEHFSSQVCFLGHSHQPLILEQDGKGKIKEYSPTKLKLKANRRYIVNVGSLGQPRDGNPDPSFVVFDSDAGTIKFHRYEYDFESTAQKIRDNGLPSPLAERLGYGM